MKYVVKLKPSVKKQLKRLDKKQAERILVKIYLLTDDPFPNASEPMVGRDAYRLRVGDYRIIYEVHNQELLVQVIRVGHRKDVYKK